MKLVRRMAGYSPWAVAVAVALDTASVTRAQTPLGRPVTTATTAAPRGVDGDAVVNITVAWLADPGLFRCHLTARPGPQGIELIGFVPNEFARQKALAVAAAVCSAPVNDRIKVQQGMPVAMTRAAMPEELAPDASTLLAETLGDKVLGLRVVCPRPGHVEVTGRLDSSTDKLTASKCLQKLSGCTHVVNRITTPGSSEMAGLPANVPMTASLTPANRAAADAMSMPVMPIAMPPASMTMTRPAATPRTEAPTMVRTEIKPTPKPIETVGRTEDGPSIMMPSPAKLETKPVEVSKVAPPIVPEIRSGEAATPKKIELLPESPKPVMSGKASVTDMPMAPKPAPVAVTESPKKLELAPELAATPTAAPELPKRIDLLPEQPKPAVAKASDPIIVPPLVEQPRPAAPVAAPPMPAPPVVVVTPPMPAPPKPAPAAAVAAPAKASVASSPYGGTPVKPVAAPPIEMAKAPEPAKLDLPVLNKIETSAAPTAKPAGRASVSDLPSSKPIVSEAPKVEPPKPAVVQAPKLEQPKPEPAVAQAPKLEQPKPAPVKHELPAVVKSERGATPAPTPTTAPQLKPVSFAATPTTTKPLAALPETQPSQGATLTGIIRQPTKDGSMSLDAETARKAVEDCCRSAATDVKVATGGARQMTVSLKVGTQSQWENLYGKIKSMPETAGHAVIYNVQVTGTGSKAVAMSAPTPVNSLAPAPMLGVIRSSGLMSVEPEAARMAVEGVCKGKADEITVKTTPGKQIAVSMKVKSSAEWDRLYETIKSLPEVTGYSVIYNVSVK